MIRRLLTILLSLLKPKEPAVPYDRDVLLAMLKRHEGYRDKLYFDSEGKLTVGVGHLVGSKPVPEHVQKLLQEPGMMDVPFAPDVIEHQFLDDAGKHEAGLRVLAGLRNVDFDNLSSNRQMALIDMAFNLGVEGLGKFTKMWTALEKGDYNEAADQAMDSKWARQVGTRASELASMIREG